MSRQIRGLTALGGPVLERRRPSTDLLTLGRKVIWGWQPALVKRTSPRCSWGPFEASRGADVQTIGEVACRMRSAAKELGGTQAVCGKRGVAPP